MSDRVSNIFMTQPKSYPTCPIITPTQDLSLPKWPSLILGLQTQLIYFTSIKAHGNCFISFHFYAHGNQCS